MSILIKGNNGTGGSSGSGKGFPIGNVSNLKINNGSKNVILYWSDPDNSIYNNITLSTWQSTIIVRKEGSAPNSIKDGTIILENTERDKYKETPYIDSNVEIGKTYYYRFFTMNTDKIYNDSSDMIRNVTIKEYDPILKNNSWEIINTVSETGLIPETWKVGDEIDITLSGDFNETITLQIWDFNHFDKSDGSGKAGICFGMKNLMKDQQPITSTSTNTGGWGSSYMRKEVIPRIISSMPIDLQNVLKEVNTYACNGIKNSKGLLSVDKIFLPGFTELYYDNIDENKSESGQTQFPIFTNAKSRMKTKIDDNTIYPYWTRSRTLSGGYYFSICNSNGYMNQYDCGIHNCQHFCFCFNI